MIVIESVCRLPCRKPSRVHDLRCGAFPDTHMVKTRESVAKSPRSVNEKNARLAWRNACLTPLVVIKTQQVE
jgi:hypothetical protein